MKQCHSKICKTTCQSLGRNPCFNGGKCVTNKTALKTDVDIAFNCVCPQGFTGDLCLTFKACDFEPCKENEVCYEYGELGHYYCLCTPEMTGYPNCNLAISKINHRNNLTGIFDIQEIVYGKNLKKIIRFYFNICLLGSFFAIFLLIIYKLKLMGLIN